MEYGYTTAEDLSGLTCTETEYDYATEGWKDLLISYAGQSIEYDEIGNPTQVTDNEGNVLRSYTWEHGRELASMTDGTTTWTYTYDANGMRTERSNGTTTYEYVYNGSQLVQMTVGSDTLYFTSDTVTYNGTVYYYVKNLQGDVAAIINSSGAPAVLYAYDAWGNILSIDGTMANTLGTLNPIRYRGYVYDQESGLYYLQSRYYDPEIGRFINADALVSTGQGVLGNNMFAYCRNNPASHMDITGTEDTVAYNDGELLSDDDLFDHGKGAYGPPLPRQGPVTGNRKAPPVDAGKQGKHVPGHQNYQPDKSSWPEGQTGVQQTQEAWMNGVKDYRKPTQEVRIGIASDGTIVRVHMGGNGWIHGYPYYRSFE